MQYEQCSIIAIKRVLLQKSFVKWHDKNSATISNKDSHPGKSGNSLILPESLVLP